LLRIPHCFPIFTLTNPPPFPTIYHRQPTSVWSTPLSAHDIRLIVLDLDGTVLTSRKTISPRTHTALRLALDRGIHVVFATARPPRSVRTYYDHLKMTTPQINYNGALIWDEPNRKVLHHVPLAVDRARLVIDFARKLYPQIMVSVEILDKWYTDHYADMPEYMTETAKHFTPDFVGPIESFLSVPVTKVMLLGDPVWIADLEVKIPKKFHKKVGQTRSDPHILQILATDVTKGRALARVAAMLKVTPAHIMAIGDAPNDADMLEYAGLPIVPSNAWDRIKPLAKFTVASNDEDGVAEAIDRFVLVRKKK